MDLPPGLRVLEVGPDWVLGVARDDLDVPRVRVHTPEALTPAGTAAPMPGSESALRWRPPVAPSRISRTPTLRHPHPGGRSLGLDFIRRTYEAWGEEDPLYAVLTQRSKKGGKWDPEAFFRRGREEIAEVMRYLDRVEGADPGRGRALDFGCGVGRLTQALAEHFDEVVGVDISSSMVERARDFNRHGERVTYRVNIEPDLALLGDDRFDLVYSNITLQHVPPRYIRRYVPEFFRVLRPGGVALFQMRHGPRVRPGSLRHWLYRVNREHLRHLLQRLAGRPPYEIHYMARSQMEALIEEGGGRLVDVVDTDGRGKSFRYCAVAA